MVINNLLIYPNQPLPEGGTEVCATKNPQNITEKREVGVLFSVKTSKIQSFFQSEICKTFSFNNNGSGILKNSLKRVTLSLQEKIIAKFGWKTEIPEYLQKYDQ